LKDSFEKFGMSRIDQSPKMETEFSSEKKMETFLLRTFSVYVVQSSDENAGLT